MMITNKYKKKKKLFPSEKKKKVFITRKKKKRRIFFFIIIGLFTTIDILFGQTKPQFPCCFGCSTLSNHFEHYYTFLDNNVKSMLPLAMCSTNDNGLPKVFNPLQQKSKKNVFWYAALTLAWNHVLSTFSYRIKFLLCTWLDSDEAKTLFILFSFKLFSVLFGYI